MLFFVGGSRNDLDNLKVEREDFSFVEIHWNHLSYSSETFSCKKPSEDWKKQKSCESRS